MAGNTLRIPNFVKARSPKRLRELMLEANGKHGLQHEWLNIQYVEKDDSWYAWYMEIVDLSRAIQDAQESPSN